MKLAFAIFKYFPHGGLQRDMMRIAAEAASRGHEVTVYTERFEGEMPENIGVERLNVSGWSNHARARSFAACFAGASEGADLRIGFNRIPGLDIYFAGDNCFALQAMRHSRVIRQFLPRYRTFLAFEKAVFSPAASTRIMHITPKQKRDFQSVYGTQEERFCLLPPGIPGDRRRPAEAEALERRRKKRAEFGIAEDEILLLQVGSGFRTKGVDRNIAAFAALPPELRGRSRLLIAGREKSRRFEKTAEQLGAAERIIFAGGRDDVADLLLAADLMTHPARNEAAGAVLTEALAAGLPVIASGCCGFEYLVRASGGIVLAEPFEQRELEAVLAKCIGEPARLAKLTADAREYGKNADFCRRAESAADFIEGEVYASANRA